MITQLTLRVHISGTKTARAHTGANLHQQFWPIYNSALRARANWSILIFHFFNMRNEDQNLTVVALRADKKVTKEGKIEFDCIPKKSLSEEISWRTEQSAQGVKDVRSISFEWTSRLILLNFAERYQIVSYSGWCGYIGPWRVLFNKTVYRAKRAKASLIALRLVAGRAAECHEWLKETSSNSVSPP